MHAWLTYTVILTDSSTFILVMLTKSCLDVVSIKIVLTNIVHTSDSGLSFSIVNYSQIIFIWFVSIICVWKCNEFIQYYIPICLIQKVSDLLDLDSHAGIDILLKCGRLHKFVQLWHQFVIVDKVRSNIVMHKH